LYAAFNAVDDSYDMLVKVDADMEVEHSNIFASAHRKLIENPEIQNLQVTVFDFMSQRRIGALHFYRPGVQWNLSIDDTFTDMAPVPPSQILFDDVDLAPAAKHCFGPSMAQAVRYGLHRGSKAWIAADRGLFKRARFHLQNAEGLYSHFCKTLDQKLGVATLSTEIAILLKFDSASSDYSSPTLRQMVSLFSGMELDELLPTIIYARNANAERKAVWLAHAGDSQNQGW
jgi:hypothetical protein